LAVIAAIVLIVMAASSGEEESSPDYADSLVGRKCKSLYKSSPWYKKRITALLSDVENLKIGPCGHVYGYYNNQWTFITSSFASYSSIDEYKPVKLGSKSGTYQNGCKSCVMRIDERGFLWYTDDDDIVSYYNPFTKGATHLDKHDYRSVPIQQVAFKDGKVYGLSKAKGIYLFKDDAWTRIIPRAITSFQAISDSAYDFVVKNGRKI